MKKDIITRREALKRMMLYTGGFMFVPSLLGLKEAWGRAPFSAKFPSEEDLFYIRRIDAVVSKKMSLAPIDFESNTRKFIQYSIVFAGKPTRRGTLDLDLSEDVLSVNVCREGSFGHHQYVSLRETVHGEECEMSRWNYSVRFASSPDSKPLHGVVTEGEGIVSQNQIVVQEGETRHSYEQQCAQAALSWNLFWTMETFARKGQTVSFDMIDECDAYAGVRHLSPYKRAVIEMNGKSVELQGWRLTGHGVVPYFFWLDDQNHLLFANTGMVVFVRV